MSDIFKKPFKIVELYPSKMNIYGDTGNADVIERRFALYGFKTRRVQYEIGDEFPKDVDMILAGGGQDSEQKQIADDLKLNGERIKSLVENGVPVLAICGAFQLFANYFELQDGSRIEGIGVFDAFTVAKKVRLIGNVVATSPKFGKLIGYENHSGQTFLEPNSATKLLSTVLEVGAGNNSSKTGEGAIKNNAIGTYLHGAFLPKNPQVADFLINCAVNRRFKKEVTLEADAIRKLDDLAFSAREVAAKRPR